MGARPGTLPFQGNPAIAPDGRGGFVVVWSATGSRGDLDVFGRHFLPDGTPAGEPFRLNDATASNQTGPAVANAGEGWMVAVWMSDSQDGDGPGIFGRIFELP